MADVVGIATVDSGGRTHTIDTGQKTAANSLPVVLASDTKRIEDCTLTACGEFASATLTSVVLPTVTAKFVRLKARSANAGSVYVGLTGVTKGDGSVDTTSGLELAAGDDTGWVPATNLNTFFRAADNATDSILYWVLA
jgi:hypothetical protein